MRALSALQRSILSLALLTGWVHQGIAQEVQNVLRTPSIGFKYGLSVADELLPEGDSYSPTMLMFSYGKGFTRKPSVKKHVWGWYAELQMVPVHLDNDGAVTEERPKETEFGMNLGIRYDLLLGPRWMFHAGLGSGPHYITTVTDLQSNGFIFSDNLFARTTFRPGRTPGKLGIIAEYRVRHISNAGLKASNAGIDNMFAVVGMTWIPDAKAKGAAEPGT